MSIAIILYLIAVVFFCLAAVGWRPFCIPVGLAFFALAHVLVGVTFRGG